MLVVCIDGATDLRSRAGARGRKNTVQHEPGQLQPVKKQVILRLFPQIPELTGSIVWETARTIV